MPGCHRRALCPSDVRLSASAAARLVALRVAQLLISLITRGRRGLCATACEVINSLMDYRAEGFVYLSLGPSLAWALGRRTP
jgi:hypothetical protein